MINKTSKQERVNQDNTEYNCEYKIIHYSFPLRKRRDATVDIKAAKKTIGTGINLSPQ